ncbi:hypothetical protein CSV79_07125 [Sporosarcina sp. P13]|uniref:YktB family protein n=1 Tax=Sporosarcina sp. P13 TaxID=2048263 RepID=UPI000C166AF7|nr:DUF1054 domain-containing protein [Sporosarcina sp. P13]PIC64392.1 hypothetical protein CSV79_07125 [Sporosarcina sp. P13]
MTQTYWTTKDFEVFTINGLDSRMTALQEIIQPKFRELGTHFSHHLSTHGKGEFFPHVAKHARRTVNPPKDSWVAFAPAKRGYKALPHFQIGLWSTHLFITLAIIYENPDKVGIAERLERNMKVLTSLPGDFIVSGDHMKPDAELISEVGTDGLEKVLERLQTVKKAEFLVGRHVLSEQATKMDEQEFYNFVEDTFTHLLSVYDIVINSFV